MSDWIKKGGFSLPSGHYYFQVGKLRVSLLAQPAVFQPVPYTSIILWR
ncbi:MAG: hypothetical protein F6K65_25305 [Moorea sp. SIO3C2]|nr:hypothetical protein [Moorena sp. SIO3C2]